MATTRGRFHELVRMEEVARGCARPIKGWLAARVPLDHQDLIHYYSVLTVYTDLHSVTQDVPNSFDRVLMPLVKLVQSPPLIPLPITS